MSRSHLILVPGLLCDDAVWVHQAAELQNIADVTIADHCSMDSFQAMADAILEQAPQRFALAGHSMGGRVAFGVVAPGAERIVGVALLDTAFTPRATGVAAKWKRSSVTVCSKGRGNKACGVWGQSGYNAWCIPRDFPDEHLMNAILDMIARKTPEIFAAQIKALLERPDATDVLGQIRCPALVLCGRQDFWSVLAHHEEMASMIPHSHLVIIENCGHMSTMERPAEVTAARCESGLLLCEFEIALAVVVVPTSRHGVFLDLSVDDVVNRAARVGAVASR